MEKQIVFLLEELEEKYQLIRSLLEQLPKCNDGIKISQELWEGNTKLFEEETISKEDEIEETTILAYRNKEKVYWLDQIKHHAKQKNW